MDVVVNATWLALYWAKTEANTEAESALKKLILEWPMDFILFTGESPEEIEEKQFKWAVNMTSRVERLRDFLGLETCNLLRIVAKACDIVTSKICSGKKAQSQKVHEWLAENVNWGTFHCPDVPTVERHMVNWTTISKNQRVLDVIESSMQRWGRNNTLDWPSKLQAIIGKSTDANCLSYVVEALYVKMMRANNKDPYGVSELKKVISDIMWVRTYFKALLRQYPAVISVNAGDGKATTNVTACKQYLDSPPRLLFQDRGSQPRPDVDTVAPERSTACLDEARAGDVVDYLCARDQGGASENWPG